jgi:hypothetical protein
VNGLGLADTLQALVSGVVAAVVVIALVLAALRRLGVDLKALADPEPELPTEAAASLPRYQEPSMAELVARANSLGGWPVSGAYLISDLPVVPGREES